jgi:hypothetical protein
VPAAVESTVPVPSGHVYTVAGDFWIYEIRSSQVAPLVRRVETLRMVQKQ